MRSLTGLLTFMQSRNFPLQKIFWNRLGLPLLRCWISICKGTMTQKQMRPDLSNATAVSGLETADFSARNIPPEVLTWIVNNTRQGSKVLEFGGGKSTRELSKFFAVTTIEHDLTFIAGKGSRCIRAELLDGYYEPMKLEEALREQYEVVIVDGPPAWRRSEAKCRLGFQKWLGRLGNCPVIVVDDVNRPWDYVNLALVLIRTGRSPLIFGYEHKLCAVIQRKLIRPADIGWIVGYALRRITRFAMRWITQPAGNGRRG